MWAKGEFFCRYIPICVSRIGSSGSSAIKHGYFAEINTVKSTLLINNTFNNLNKTNGNSLFPNERNSSLF